MKKISILIGLLFTTHAFSQEISGSWSGNLEAPGLELPVIFHIESFGSTLMASMDSPKQGAFGIRADSTGLKEDQLEIKFVRIGVVYKGSYNSSSQVINGTFSQGGMNIPLNLKRQQQTEEEEVIARRPQEPQDPLPYHSEEVTFTNPTDGIRLAGTLTFPRESTQFPAVVLISGSGPQNRDSEAFGHRPFLVLSDHLTKNGIAVLRFDERGVGKSTGDFSTATSRNFANDVVAAINFLISRREVDTDRIGLIGHSEGGIVAPMVADQSEEVDFMVLLAGPSLPGDQNLLLQKRLIEEKMGVNEETVALGQQIFQEAYGILKDPDTTGLNQRVRSHLQNAFASGLSDDQVEALVEQLTSPWMVFYLNHDPAEVLRRIDIPTLALFAKNDLQVPADENARTLLEGDYNNEWTIRIFENLNHLFQESPTGLPHEYSQIEETISPIVLETISTWILEQN